MRSAILAVMIGFTAAGVGVRPASAQERPAGRINNLKVLSDKIDDVTTAENILKSFVKPGMKDDERTKALWTAIVRYRHQWPPPDEQLAGDWEAHDPGKIFNVYGYCMCCCCSAMVASLNRMDGREVRGRTLNGHSVPEVKYGGGWHMYDTSLITYFPKPGGGDVADCDEIAKVVADWYAKNPGYKGNEKKINDLMRKDGWTGWKPAGPELLSNCPFYDLGWFPARTHGWNSTMIEYNQPPGHYEYGYQVGHRALFSLRPGESLTRESGNRGLHVNMQQNPGFDQLKVRAAAGDLVYLKQYLPGYTGPVVGNGVHRYAPGLAADGLAGGAEVYENLASAAASPTLRPKAAGKPGVAVVPMVSPYVYLGGRVTVRAFRKSDADSVVVSLSTNNGRTFAPVWKAEKTGASEGTVDFKDKVLRRYAYWIKVEISGDAGLDALAIESDVQHAPRTMAWLGQGATTITVAADSDTALTTRSISCRIHPDGSFVNNETTHSMGVTFENLKVDGSTCWWQGGVGAMIVPIETPGDMVNLRFGAEIRARGDRDVVKLLLSFDGGKTWKPAGAIKGPTPGVTQYFSYKDIPAGTRKAMLKYELTGNNTVGLFSFRVDADHRDPLAAKAFRPFTVVHRWKEGGAEKVHRETIARLPAKYTITAGPNPEMISVGYEMAEK